MPERLTEAWGMQVRILPDPLRVRLLGYRRTYDGPSQKDSRMLLLSRKTGERIVLTVGEEVIVVVLSKIEGRRAKIGIEASQNVKIRRAEIEEKHGNSASTV